MSLVSYEDSDESGEENVNDTVLLTSVDRKDEMPALVEQTTVKKIESIAFPNRITNENIESEESSATKTKSIGSLFSSLPVPWKSSVSWTDKNLSKDVKKVGQSNTVKISLPNLEANSDSDDEDYAVRKKSSSIVDSQKSTRLFSMLPKPKHGVVVKENNPNRPVAKLANRPLIPDSLRRKQAKNVSSTQVKKSSAQTSKMQESDDESDHEESGSFFSWSEKIAVSESTDVSTSQITSGSTTLPVSGQVEESANVKTAVSTTNVPLEFSVSPEAPKPPQPYPSHDLDSGVDMQGNPQSLPYSNIDPNVLPDYSGTNENASFNYSASSLPYHDTTSDSYGYAMGYSGNSGHYQTQNYNDQYVTSQTPVDWQQPAQPANQEQPEQLKRFLGKRGRGEENIAIIDVSADDQVSSSHDWRSNYQKEDLDNKPLSKKKGSLPSSQSRRKHQITYLAFQAKEREWELRNQWSANRQTRRQTQAKYGF